MHGERIERIRDVMTPEPITVTPTMTIEQAARRMRDAGIGNVVVLNGGQITGILTDRDIVVRAVAEGWPVETPVGEVAQPGADHHRPRREHRRGGGLDARALDPPAAGGRARAPVGIVSLGDLALERNPESALGEISAAPPND